jgi:succinyl-CoA synthetase beta subunit
MKIHEYQGKEILRKFGVPVPRGIAAFTVQEAVEAAQKLGGPVWVVKAQIHAGGRGKGGGVKVAKSIDDVKRLAGDILGMQLKTHQTGPEGQKVRRLYIEDGADIKKEYYVSIVTDRATQKVAVIASSEGGMDIEEVAHSTPEKIITELVDPLTGLGAEQALKIAQAVGLTGASAAQAADVLQKLYTCYMDTDASLVEINPLNCDSKGNIMALDSKFNFDANALFRHPEIVALRDLDEEDPAEVEASKFDLAYISLDGNIGCLVNGAGLAMATMDTIKLFGGEPANFLDVGGGATAEKVTEAFKIMLKNKNVKGILVNIFGGIMKCDTIASGVISCLQGGEPVRAAGGAHEGHQRGTGQEAAGRVRPAHHRCRHHGRSRPRRSWQRSSKEQQPCRSTSTKTPRSSPRASPARPGSSTPKSARNTPTARTASSRA